MNHPARHFYEFGRFRVDATERQLFCDGELLPLPPKAFDTLLVLIQNSGHLLTRDELMKTVWANSFVEENNLTQYVSALRKTLNGSGEQFIETVPRRGYRFTAGVRETWEGDADLVVNHRTRQRLTVTEEIQEEGEQDDSEKRILSWRFLVAAVAVAAILVFGLIWATNPMQNNEARSLPLTRGTKNREAFELYQKGRALWQTRRDEDLHEATLLLEQAVQKDPYFALAHSALADAYAFDYRHWGKAETAAREAIRLDPNLGASHATIGFVKMFWKWELHEAESELKQAVNLSPNYATAHHWYAINLLATGQAGGAALAEMSRALELEPNSLSINSDMCQMLYFLRRYDEAITQCQKTLSMDAGFYYAHNYLYEIYNAKEMSDEAVKTYFKMEELRSQPSPPNEQEEVREAYRIGGIRAFWKARIESLPDNVPHHYRIAQHYARLGNQDEAFSHLQKAYETHDFDFILFLSDPCFEELRLDRRYLKLKDSLLN